MRRQWLLRGPRLGFLVVEVVVVTAVLVALLPLVLAPGLRCGRGAAAKVAR